MALRNIQMEYQYNMIIQQSGLPPSSIPPLVPPSHAPSQPPTREKRQEALRAAVDDVNFVQ